MQFRDAGLQYIYKKREWAGAQKSHGTTIISSMNVHLCQRLDQNPRLKGGAAHVRQRNPAVAEENEQGFALPSARIIPLAGAN